MRYPRCRHLWRRDVAQVQVLPEYRLPVREIGDIGC
jgi:hypothetical protein